MAVRIEGVIIPEHKRIEAALCYVHGIGLTTAKKILAQCSINPDVRVKNLESSDIAKLQKEITDNHKVEGELRKEVMLSIKRLMEIGSYRGIRHKRSLPVRGQRTKTNARTRKGTSKRGKKS